MPRDGTAGFLKADFDDWADVCTPRRLLMSGVCKMTVGEDDFVVEPASGRREFACLSLVSCPALRTSLPIDEGSALPETSVSRLSRSTFALFLAGLLAVEPPEADFRLAPALVVTFVVVGTNSSSSADFRLLRVLLSCVLLEEALETPLVLCTCVEAADVACDVSLEVGACAFFDRPPAPVGISKTSVSLGNCWQALCLVACDTLCSLPLPYVIRFDDVAPGNVLAANSGSSPIGSGALMACVDGEVGLAFVFLVGLASAEDSFFASFAAV